MSALITFVKKNRLHAAILIFLVVIAAYFRFWNLQNEFHFMGDQGRDALIVSRIFTDGNLVFIGPVMSVGNIYLGPFYYYFMLPFLYVSYPSPIGPVYAVGVLNIITILLLYGLGKKMVGSSSALIAAALMTVSEIAVYHSRFSWNPNIVPFVSLLMVFFSYQAVKKSSKWWLAVGACMGVLIQLHYVTLLAGAAAGLIWLWRIFGARKKISELKSLTLYGVGAVIVFFGLLSPLILFDYRHEWSNFRALGELFSDEDNFAQGSSVEVNDWVSAPKVVFDTVDLIFFEKHIGELGLWNTVMVIGLVLSSIFVLLYKRKNKEMAGFSILLVYAIVGVIGFSFYEHRIFDHYIAFLLPILFLITGTLLAYFTQKNTLLWILVAGYVGVFAHFNIQNITFKAGGPTQKELKDTAESIHNRVEVNEPYAIVLLSESQDLYGMNYRYFLNTNLEKRPVDSETFGQAQKLFIINEEQATDRPQDLPIYEIVTFEDKEPKEVYTLPQGISITVLTKNSGI